MPDCTVLSVNINMGLDVSRRRFVLPRLRDAVRQADADVVLLQEVIGEHAGLARRHPQWPSQPQHEYLAESIWPHHAYGRNAVFAGGHQGNAVLSRFPIVSQRNVDVSIAGHEPRGLLHALLEVPGIGPNRKRALLMHFGTARAVKGAALDDLERAPGISKAMARQIYDFFHPRG